MSIIRRGTPLDRDFYILDKRISEDSSISFEARGLLIFLLGKPDSWQVSIAHLAKESPSGKDKIARMLKELRDAGYVKCEQNRGDSGKLAGYVYTVFETKQQSNSPETENPVTAEKSPEPGKPDTVKPETEKPDTANPPLVSTDNKQVLNKTSNKPNVDFDDFWNAYGKKVGDKTKLAKKWNALKDHEREAAMLHIAEYVLATPDKQYRKNPETYLNNKSWNDEIIPRAGGQHGTHPQSHTDLYDELGNEDWGFDDPIGDAFSGGQGAGQSGAEGSGRDIPEMAGALRDGRRDPLDETHLVTHDGGARRDH